MPIQVAYSTQWSFHFTGGWSLGALIARVTWYTEPDWIGGEEVVAAAAWLDFYPVTAMNEQLFGRTHTYMDILIWNGEHMRAQ